MSSFQVRRTVLWTVRPGGLGGASKLGPRCVCRGREPVPLSDEDGWGRCSACSQPPAGETLAACTVGWPLGESSSQRASSPREKR